MAPRFGSHVSIAGGLPLAFERASALGCETIQIFVKNAAQWRGRPLTGDEADAFRAARAESRIGAVLAHASYLINVAAKDRVVRGRSIAALVDELARCDRLGVDALVLHPGAHLGHGVEPAITRAARALRDAVERARPRRTRLLLENTAGQGTLLGRGLDELAAIRERSGLGGQLGFCIDTCHTFAGGHAIDRPAGYRSFFEELDRHLGLGSLGALHLNDSVGGRGSRRDRHANLGAGAIGIATFRRLVHDPRLRGLPMIVETPVGADRLGHARDLETLRRLRAKRRMAQAPEGRDRPSMAR